MYIDSTAIVKQPSLIKKGVYIGAYSIIGPNVEIGENTWIDSHVIIHPNCKIGAYNKICNFSVFGKKIRCCEDLHFKSKNNDFLFIGNNNYFMANSYISSNCVIGNNIIFSENVTVANYVTIEDFSLLGEGVYVYPHVIIGKYSFSVHNSVICKSVLPYVLIFGNPARVKQLNVVWLKKNGFCVKNILKLKNIYKFIFNNGLTIKELSSLLLSKKYSSYESEILLEFLLKSRDTYIH